MPTIEPPSLTATVLPEPDWLGRRAAHERRVLPWIAPRLARQATGTRHPVDDFLFDYYSHRPSWLRRWHPGPDVVLLGNAAAEFLRWPEYRQVTVETGDGPVRGVTVDCSAFKPARRETLAWLRGLLQAVQDRPPFFGCFGLHEWAMVYRLPPDAVRHASWPLRFPPEEVARIVEGQAVCCSHFDAFRFFTPAARPLNHLQPERATCTALEQCGCLHANMDLYKWAYKLAPFCPSELMADCFALAREIREVDMCASPYDLRELGLEPITIETPEGRAAYEQRQRDFAARSLPLRARLIALCDRLLG